MKILIIDDSVEILDLLKYCIAKFWLDAEIEHYHPKLGKPDTKFNWSDYDLLILDYQLDLPDQDGFDWLRDIKLHKEVPPILFMTAYGDEDIAIQAIKLGADDYLNKKNLSPKRFYQRVKEILKAQNQNADSASGQDKIIDHEKTVPLSTQRAKEILKAQNQNADSASGQDKIIDHEKTVPLSTKKLESIKVPALQKESKKITAKKTESPSKDTKQNVGKKQKLTRKENKPIVATKTKTNTISQNSGTIVSGEGVKSGDVDVPGYKILRKIAQGGMASVYLAERTKDKLKVILKIINFIDDETKQLLQRFVSEFKLVSKLNHPNIICVYERSITSQFAYIAMEYCHGGDLSERLDKALPTKTAVSYMLQIADGIGAAHKAGIIHRDLKPSNILFRVDDSIAIADFGIAKLQSAESNITKAGLSVGTMLYISPYSLGIIFYKMLTGEYPYFSNSVEQILKAHLKSKVPKLPSELSKFQPVIDGLLAKIPDERFQSTEEFIAGLEWT